MAKKRIFMVMTLALLSTVFAAGVFAQVTVSGGFALSSTDSVKASGGGESYSLDIDGDIGVGGNIYADYLLPVGIPLSLGFEFGYDVSKLKVGTAEETLGAIPLLLRAAYHFDLMSSLDLYIVGKIGYAIGTYTGDGMDDIGGVAFGFDVGVAYYFTPLVGVFAEAGFDDYILESKETLFGYTITITAPFTRFFTAGLSLKF
jgi:opacity protein-like surface antigen